MNDTAPSPPVYPAQSALKKPVEEIRVDKPFRGRVMAMRKGTTTKHYPRKARGPRKGRDIRDVQFY